MNFDMLKGMLFLSALLRIGLVFLIVFVVAILAWFLVICCGLS